MLGDAWRNWFLILACSGLAVIMDKLLLSTLVNDPALYLAATFIGAVAFLAFLGSTILFLGKACYYNAALHLHAVAPGKPISLSMQEGLLRLHHQPLTNCLL